MPGSLIQGNALEIPLKDKSVQLCCFSPPYFGLRKYKISDVEFPGGWKGQMGLEPTTDQFLDNLMLVMEEVWRVLRDDGCVFVNIGDGYKAKSLCLVPQKFAIRCQEAGWIIRSEIILQKLNPLPEAVTDRCTRCHEQVWMLTKQGSYFWDKEAVMEKTKRVAKVGWKESDLKKYSCDPRLERQGTYKGWRKYCPTGIVKKRNIRSVWTLPTESHSEVHFATFSSKLINIIVKAGSSPRACEICGAPWERVVNYKANYEKQEQAHYPDNTPTKVDSTEWKLPTVKTLGWKPTCKCVNKGTGKCVVADIFCGIGTTVLVAEKLGRAGVGMDLSAEYLWSIALKKIRVPVQKMLELRF